MTRRMKITLGIICVVSCALFMAQTYTHGPLVSEGYIQIIKQGELRLNEAVANGTNYLFFKSPASVASNIGFVLPATAATGVLSVTNSGGTMTIATPAALASSSLATDSVTATQIASGAVGSDEIATDAVAADEIAANSVGASELDETATATFANIKSTAGTITAGSGTDITVNDAGALQRQVYKVSVGETHFTAANVTQDVVLGTLPAKTIIHRIIADVTETFACASVCTSSTLSMTCGRSAGGNEYLLSFDIDAATAQFGDAIAEVGADFTAGTTPEAWDIPPIPAWGSTSAVQCRLTSGTGNLGDGASATNLSQGAITFYIITERLP